MALEVSKEVWGMDVVSLCRDFPVWWTWAVVPRALLKCNSGILLACNDLALLRAALAAAVCVGEEPPNAGITRAMPGMGMEEVVNPLPLPLPLLVLLLLLLAWVGVWVVGLGVERCTCKLFNLEVVRSTSEGALSRRLELALWGM